MPPTVYVPALLGVCFLVDGLITYRHDRRTSTARDAFGLAPFGPVFVAAALAAFAGEHFSAGPALATLVPKWMPARLFIAYFVGVAHLAAASSYVGRRLIRWSTICLAIMFGLFVLTMDLPGAMARPTVSLGWVLAARQATFAIGALALFATVTSVDASDSSRTIAAFARIWTACVLVFYGVQHLIHPEITAGVPSNVVTAAWVPFPLLISYATGVLLILFGLAMFVRRYAATSAALCGLLMSVLTLVLYVPQFFIATNAAKQVVAINFIFDTLLFAGTILVISKAISSSERSASTP
jgi:uncharacterized membrane protein